MRKEIEERVKVAIGEKVFPGCVIGLVKKDGKREIFPFGALTYENAAPSVEEDTVYDVASITKSIPTASLAALLLEEGRLSLTDSVRTYLPELKNEYGATIEDLLRYRVFGLQMSALTGKTWDEITAHVFENGFSGPPDTSRYTNLPAFLLGLIIERVAEKPLDKLAQEHFFKPLGMINTTFSNVRPRRSNIGPTEVDESGQAICGIVHDESARVFAKAGRAVGHAGLFSTVPDILNFLETLLHYRPRRSIVEGAEAGLGWQLNDANFMGQYAGKRTFGKTGFTGTSIVCDLRHSGRAGGIAFAILSNRTYPKRPPDQNAINAFRRDIADIILKNA